MKTKLLIILLILTSCSESVSNKKIEANLSKIIVISESSITIDAHKQLSYTLEYEENRNINFSEVKISSVNLPAWLMFESNTMTLSGIPLEGHLGDFIQIFKIIYKENSFEFKLNIKVNPIDDYTLIKFDSINSSMLEIDATGNIWTTRFSSGLLNMFNGYNLINYNNVINSDIWDITHDQNHVYIAATNGLYKSNKGEIIKISDKQNFDAIESFYTDFLYAAFYGPQIYYTVNTQTDIWSEKYSNPGSTVFTNDILKDSKNRIWFQWGREQLLGFDGQHWLSVRLPIIIGGYYDNDRIYYDLYNDRLILLSQDLYYMENFDFINNKLDTKTISRISEIGSHPTGFSINKEGDYFISYGGYWDGESYAGIYKYSLRSKTVTKLPLVLKPRGTVFDKHENLWITTDDGLFVYNENGIYSL